MTKPMFENSEFKAYVKGNIPLGQLAQTEDIAAAATHIWPQMRLPLWLLVTALLLMVAGARNRSFYAETNLTCCYYPYKRITRSWQSERRMNLPGFDAEFVDLPHYIIKITDRIWHERQVETIHNYYSADCLIHTLGGDIKGRNSELFRTPMTHWRAFPDRRLGWG